MSLKSSNKDSSDLGNLDKTYQENEWDDTLITASNTHVDPSDEKTSLRRIDLTLSRRKQSDKVYLKDLTFTFNHTGRASTNNICKVSDDSYLISDFFMRSVALLDTLSGVVKTLQLPGNPSHVCKVDHSRATVFTETETFPSEVHILEIKEELSKIRSFEVEGKCLGMTYKSTRLYVARSDCISVLSLEGNNTETIFKQKKDEQIIQMTGGPNETLICVCKNDSDLIWVTLDANGRFHGILFSKPNSIPDFSPNFVAIAADLEGTIYTCYRNRLSDQKLSKINKEGHEEVNTLKSKIKALCYDNCNNMVAFLANDNLVLQSFNQIYTVRL